MRAPASAQMFRAASRVAQIPAPVGGLNARDSVADMPILDALALDNVFPARSWVEVRRGYAAHVTGLPGAVETLMDYSGATPKLFAASGSGIYDVTTAGAVGAPVVTGAGNARFQSVMFTNAAATWLVAVNGADGVRTFDGTSWAVQSITGVSASSLFCVQSWKRRLWFGEAGSSRVWYLAADAVAGAATSFNLGGVWRLGGQIAGILAPSFENGAGGIQDYIAFVSTMGEVAVYTGSDPATVGTFALLGVFRLGAPVGRRFYAQSGGDIGMLTVDGMLSLTRAIQMDRSQAANAAVTDKITRLFTEAVTAYSTNFGWQVIVYPEAQRLIVNVPETSGRAIQYVMNTVSGAWCRYTAHNAACWEVHQGGLFFGAQEGGIVYRAHTGTSDAGQPISWNIKGAFSDYGSPRQKRFTMVRPLITANADPQANVFLDIDYGDAQVTNVPVIAAGGARWGVSRWGSGRWSGTRILRPWVTTGQIGYVGAVRMTGQTTGLQMQVSAFDVVAEPAQALGI